MFLLQEVVTDWSTAFMGSLALVVLFYGIAILVFYFVIRAAIRGGMKDMARERRIANRLLAEQLKVQGGDAGRIESIVNARD